MALMTPNPVVALLVLAALTLGSKHGAAQEAPPTATRPKVAKQAPQKAAKSTSTSETPAASYAKRVDTAEVARRLASQQGLDAKWVQQVISKARYMPAIAKAVEPAPAGVRKNWGAYRERFVEPQRIGAGVQFWRENRTALERAEKQFGVPAEIIVGIIGVETLYGRHTGTHRVIDALATLAFDFPASHPKAQQRSDFFFSELGHFLKLAKTLQRDPLTIQGSYAGAMGLAQFMPSSWLKHAVNFDADTVIDLWRSPADAIGSVANYLKSYGWQHQQPTHFEVRFDDATLDKARLLEPDILPTFTWEDFHKLGARVDNAAARQYPGKWALVELLNGDDAPSYVAGTENFYVVTRYNWSSYYAMAVIELGQAVRTDLQALPERKSSPVHKSVGAKPAGRN